MSFKIIKKGIILIAFLTYGVKCQSNLIGMEFSEKENGTFIILKFDNKIKKHDITAWFQDSGWFYVTVHDVNLDSTKKWPFKKTGNILNIQTRQIGESSQIDFKLKNKIEDFDFFILNENQMNLSLRYPLSETLAIIDSITSDIGIISSLDTRVKNKWFSQNRFTFLLLGSTLISKGIIRSNDKEIILGFILTMMNYIFLN